MMTLDLLEQDLKKASHQLAFLKNHILDLFPSEIEGRIEKLFTQCNHFADQLDHLEKESKAITELEGKYIELLMELTEFDSNRHLRASRSVRAS